MRLGGSPAQRPLGEFAGEAPFRRGHGVLTVARPASRKRKQSKSPKRNKSNLPDVRSETKPDREDSSASFRTLGAALFRHRRFVVRLVGDLSAACVLYCLIAAKEFEASARIALRSSPATALSVDGANGANSTAFASDQTQLDTLADIFRSRPAGVGSHWRPNALPGSRICGKV